MGELNQRGQYVVLGVDQALLHILAGQLQASRSIAASLASLAADVKLIRKKYAGIQPSDVTGITVEKETLMGQKCSVTIVKKTNAMKAPVPHVKASLATGTFVLLDGGTGTFTTLGQDSATPPNQVDISTVATETVVSDDPKLVVGPVTGMAVTLTAPPSGTGTANVTFTATWNDGSVGPFTFVAVVSYSGGAITGITVIQS